MGIAREDSTPCIKKNAFASKLEKHENRRQLNANLPSNVSDSHAEVVPKRDSPVEQSG